MRWLPAKTGGRKFRCIDCDGPYPPKSSEALNFLSGVLERVKLLERLQERAQTAREDLEKLRPSERHDVLVQRICEMQRAIDFNRY